MGRLRKLARLSSAELVELLAAQGALIRAQLQSWLRPVGSFVSPIAPAQPPSASPGAAADAETVARAARLALSVGRAAENGIFRPACLVRALALTRMLEARGIHGSQLRVGVRLEDGEFSAHAWVEYAGRILGDRPENVTRYTPLSDVKLLEGRTVRHRSRA